MTDEPEYPCAVWYIDDYGQIRYDLDIDEESAARMAVAYDGDGTVLGLQWADGRTIPAGEWRAFAEARRRLRQLEQDRRDNPQPPVPTRRTNDPFRGRPIDIEVTEPGWLGR
jgi:hypothetical protein